MTNAAKARRRDLVPLGELPKRHGPIAKAAITSPTTTPPAEPHEPAAKPSAPVDTMLNVLFGYIPTEVITLYVAVVAVAQKDGKVSRLIG